MTEVTPPRPPQPSQYALMNGASSGKRESPECNDGGVHKSTSRQHSFPKKPPRRSLSPPRLPTVSGSDTNDGNGSPPAPRPSPAVAGSGPARPSREPPKKPMLPPGYVSRFRGGSLPDTASSNLGALLHDVPTSTTSLAALPTNSEPLDSEESGSPSPLCPSGKPIRPAKPPAKYRLKSNALQQLGTPVPPTPSSATGGSGGDDNEAYERDCNASTAADDVPANRGMPAKPPCKISLSPTQSREDLSVVGSPDSAVTQISVLNSLHCLPVAQSFHAVSGQPESRDNGGAAIPKHASQPLLPAHKDPRHAPSLTSSKTSSSGVAGGGYAGSGSDESGGGDRHVEGSLDSGDGGASSSRGSSSVQSRKAKFESRMKSIRRATAKKGPSSPAPQDTAGGFMPAPDLASAKRSFRGKRGVGNKSDGPSPDALPSSNLVSSGSAGGAVLSTKESVVSRWASDEHLSSNPSGSKTDMLSLLHQETVTASSATLPRRLSATSGESDRSDMKSSPLLKNLKKRARSEFFGKKFSSSSTASASSNGNGSTASTPGSPGSSGRRYTYADDKGYVAVAAAATTNKATAAASPATGNQAFRTKLRPVPMRAISTEEEDSDNDDAQSGSSLFQYVYVISLAKDAGGKYTPQVSYRFPPKLDGDAASKDEGLQSISAFCFPDLQCWTEPVSTYKSETFSFILTDVGGGKRFGYCRRLLPSKKRPCMPEVYCIISPLGCFGLYSKILDQVELRLARSSSAVFAFLKAVIAKPFPGPGRKVVVAAFGAGGSGMETVVLKRPKDSSWLEHVDFDVLASKLPCDVLLKVFAAVVMERHLIFVAERLSTLSSCILACVALIYPFEWQHVFIPVLPASLVDICCSPLPYIIGVMKTSLDIILSGDLPIEEDVVIIDLDEGRLLTEVLNDVGSMPNKLRSELESSLKSAYSKSSKDKDKDKDEDASDRKQEPGTAMVNACLKFFVQTTGHYRKCFKATDELEFDFPMFIKSGSKSSIEFLSLFTRTQMFDMFIQERSDPVNVTSAALGIFEQAIVENYGQAEDYLSGRSAFKLHKQAKAKLKGFIKKS